VIIFFGYTLFVVFKQKLLSEIQKDFVNTMSHEIKTPISTIDISANVLMQPDIIYEPARLLNYAGIIKSENQRLLKLSDKILQMARTEKSDFKLMPEEVNVHEIIEDVKSKIPENKFITTRLMAQNSNIEADRIHFSNVIFNLLDNAVKYSASPVSVNITAENTGKYIAVIIADKGIGIKKEHQKLIFRKFYRVEGVSLPNVKGFGLGLNYVKNICDAHKWKITVQSEPGEGSKFIILIPTL
jgi:two-component system phosphate regulon sensor histidine kinase PhoR